MKPFVSVLLLGVSCLSAGCGSSEDAQPDAGVDAGFVWIPSDGGTHNAPVDSGWPSAWITFEDQVLAEVNQRRAQPTNCGATMHPAVPPLTMNAALRTAARLHTRDMAENDYFSHTGQDGSTPSQRIAEAGYSGSTIGENIAAGSQTPEAVVANWMTSPGHCRNIMHADFDHIGVGYAYDDASTYGHYWTQTFGGGGP